MKHFYLICMSVFFSFFSLKAQEIISVTPGSTLNDVITSDPGRIYELTRGAIYFVNAPVEHEGFTLHLRSVGNPDFARPLIVSDPPSADVEINALFEARGELILEGIHLTQRSTLGVIFERMIRARANDIRIIVDDCLFDDSGQTTFRLDNAGVKLYVSNCIISRMGETNNPDNGRFIDDRGNDVDSVVMTNNLVYNVTSRVIRDGGGNINYAAFNQNTIANTGQRCIAVGPVETFVFTNNIISDGAFLGRQFSLDPEEQDDRTVVDPDTIAGGNVSNWIISHNNIFRNQALVDATPFTQVDLDTIEQVPYWNELAIQAVTETGTAATNIDEVLEFTNPAPLSIGWVMAHHQEMDAPNWDHNGIAPDPVLTAGVGDGSISRYSTYHDYGYSQGAQSYTAGTEGQPIGANLSGFNFPTSIQDLFVEANILYYPNPVAQTLFIRNLSGILIEGIALYDAFGRPVRHLQNVNTDRTEIDLSNLPAGLYLLSLFDSEGRISTRQIIKE